MASELEKAINKYLDSLHTSNWPMQTYTLTRTDSREQAVVFIKKVILGVMPFDPQDWS